MQAGLAEISPEDGRIIGIHDVYRAEIGWIEAVENSIEAARGALTQTSQLLETKLSYYPISDQWPHASTVTRVAETVDELRKRVAVELNTILSSLAGFPAFPAELREHIARLRTDHSDHEQAYRESLSRASSNEQQLTDIRSLESEITDLEKRMTAYQDEVQTLTSLQRSETTDPMQQWVNLHEQRHAILVEQAALLSTQAEQAFLVTIQKAGNPSPIRSKLQVIINCGKNIRTAEEKIRALTNQVIDSRDPHATWIEIIDEFRTLTDARVGGSPLPTKRLEKAGFSQANLAALRDGLEPQLLEDLRYVQLNDDIVFQFTFGKEADGTARYIPFQDASPGQQATVLLKALLGRDGPPLLIDQPEEDLDNEQVNVIADHIRRTKHHRQLVFVSHNANLVVNGDSELVACFGYRTPSDQTSATIVREGSIDFEPVRNIVTSVMEGGRAAFDLRRQKYNF